MIVREKDFVRIKNEFELVLKSSSCKDLKEKLKLTARDGSPPLNIDRLTLAEKKEWGEWVLQLYFFQLFYLTEPILDLSPSSFYNIDLWAPRPQSYKFNPTFLTGIRNVYWGLFCRQRKVFLKGLALLNVKSLEKIIIEHFKNAERSPVRFTGSDLMKSGKDVFLQLLKTRTIPPKDSLAFGVYLGSMYKTLSRLDTSLDVNLAFQKSTPKRYGFTFAGSEKEVGTF